MRVSVLIAWGLLNDDSMTLLGFEMLSQTLISVGFFFFLKKIKKYGLILVPLFFRANVCV